MRWSTFVAVLLGVVFAVALVLLLGRLHRPPPLLPQFVQGYIDPEVQAERDFYRNHPGEKPLNWLIGRKAIEFHRLKPMGHFQIKEPANDCSDYVECIVDDALGAKARFRRNSRQHLLTRMPELWDAFYWDHRTPLQPGDMVSVTHSPHYPPHEGSIGHAGVVGSDGMVYDWTKLKIWPHARYGCHTVEWFTRNSPGPDEVQIWRLNALYRYKARPLPFDVP